MFDLFQGQWPDCGGGHWNPSGWHYSSLSNSLCCKELLPQIAASLLIKIWKNNCYHQWRYAIVLFITQNHTIPRFITEISSTKICRHIIITILIFNSVSGLTMFYRGNDKTEMITVTVNWRVMRGYSKKTLKEKIWYSLS